MWEVYGHDRAVRLLQRSIESGRVSHAYLLTGPRQVGKGTLARELARALNCTEADRPCGVCRSCRKIAAGVHPDVQCIALEEGSKNISIDAVRALQSSVALHPYEARARVYILEDADRLSEPAANSLLKTLEEPPSFAVLILTALDPALLLPTLVSRCQRIELRPVPPLVIQQTLVEQRGIDEPYARVLAGLADGRMGWALQAAGDPSILQRHRSTLERLARLGGESRVDRFAYAAELAALYPRDSQRVREVLAAWRSWWRDLLLTKIGMGERATNLELAGAIAAESSRYSIEGIGRMVAAIQETISVLSQNVNPRLALEALMLSAPAPSAVEPRIRRKAG